MTGLGFDIETLEKIRRRIRACDYLAVAQIFLQNNFLLNSPLTHQDIKPRLLGHWGTCHGINVTYANLKAYFDYSNFTFVLGPGHGFPALQANLFIDGELAKIDPKATQNYHGLAYVCRNFSWPNGFPSHASPSTPHVITEGGELGYALANAYGFALGHPETPVVVLIGDGELETATTLASLNLNHLLSTTANGPVIPILHLNGYKISAPSIYARISDRELNELLRGFGFSPIFINDDNPRTFQFALSQSAEHPFYILKTSKGAGGPNRHHFSHQVPLKKAKTDLVELQALEDWLKSYHFHELFNQNKGFTL